MKVVFTVDALINAGTEKSILETVSHFSGSTQTSVVYFFPRHELKDQFDTNNIPLHFLNCSGRFSIIKGVFKFYKFVKQEKPDIVVSSLFRANIISRIVCKIAGVKLVGTFVSDSYSSLRSAEFSWKRKLGFYFVYLIDRTTSFIPQVWIANSESVKKSNCRKLGVRGQKVQVIYRGRESSKFRACYEYQLKKPFVFITLGRLYKTKGYFELIDAVAMTAKWHPHIEFHIYGDGPDRKSIEDKISKKSLQQKVLLHGNKAEAWKFLYSANCFVFPSHYEGFSGALVEAMMTGIPIIASDIPMNLEAVEPGRTALIHKVNNAESLAACMIKMIDGYDTLKDMGKAAKEEAFSRFDIKSISYAYENFLRTIQNTSLN